MFHYSHLKGCAYSSQREQREQGNIYIEILLLEVDIYIKRHIIVASGYHI
jgi:hypothetical protein